MSRDVPVREVVSQLANRRRVRRVMPEPVLWPFDDGERRCSGARGRRFESSRPDQFQRELTAQLARTDQGPGLSIGLDIGAEVLSRVPVETTVDLWSSPSRGVYR